MPGGERELNFTIVGLVRRGSGRLRVVGLGSRRFR